RPVGVARARLLHHFALARLQGRLDRSNLGLPVLLSRRPPVPHARTGARQLEQAAVSTQTRPDINLLDREFWKSRQHEAWTWARANEPVYFDANSQVWAITKHADILYVERHDELFSSEGAYRLNPSPGEANMIAADDPQHLKQRRLVNRGFTPSAVDEWDPHFDKMLDE